MDILIVILLTLILAVLAAGAVLAFILVKRAGEQIRLVQSQVEEFFNPGKDNAPSPFALVIQNSSAILAGEIERRISAMMMGKASAVSKAVGQVEEEIAGEAMTQANPLLGALINFSPALRRKIARSPALGQALQGLSAGGLGGLLGGSNNGHKTAAGSGGSQSKLGF